MELGVGGGTKLRLYDAVVMPPPYGFGDGVFLMVLCTRVCVLYLEELPSLPDA